MNPLVHVAVRAARRAGAIIVRYLERVENLRVEAKSRNDFVTEVDRHAEREIVAVIRKFYPQHAILGEEGGRSGGGESLWIIDPLDGTTNFLHGNPVFAVSIAYQHKGRLEAACIFDPLRQEIFTAARGAGAFLDERRIRVSRQRTLDGALIATGFPYRANLQYADAYLAMLKRIMAAAAGVRRAGSAALDLAYVACGRFDGFWELGLQPWDTAAGTLLVQEAGGLLGTLTGAPYRQGGNVIAAPPKLFKELVQAIAPLVPAALRDA
ncbi:MAG: inositol monophosphatase [Steroidobacteraceae bacterium]|nr:inositol monophosphatase [Steroidobacteraceae bacterium]MDW8260880.1 inositol monophosphatase family protein [Gammaproteobacteria bacterium]